MTPRPAPPEVDRAAAAKAAIAARRARAAVKHDIATKRRTALGAAQRGWDDPTSAEAGLRVVELLTSVPTLGPTRVAKVLADLEISDKKRVGGLGIRQRQKLQGLSHAAPGRRAVTIGRARGPDRRGQGHRIRVHPRQSSRSAAQRLGDNASAAPGRDRRGALLLRQR